MDILIIGGGGREHAIAWKLRQSPKIGKIYCAPGNAGFEKIENSECVDIQANNIDGLLEFALKNNIEFTVVGPEEPLILGIVDVFEQNGMRIFGPRKNAAMLEGSKVFAKNLMKKYKIPTADYDVFDNISSALLHINNSKSDKFVIKADGIAVGKGVLICEGKTEAAKALNDIFIDRKFGKSGDKVVIEEYLEGNEISILAFCDGKTIVPMLPARDHKRAKDGDEGLNTGGMGAVAGVPDYTGEAAQICMDRIFTKTVDALSNEGIEYKGIIFFGLMLTKSGPKVIEYNARFGDPETEAVLPLLENDLADILDCCERGSLSNINISFKNSYSACVVIASNGYPENYEKGFLVSGLEHAESKPNNIVFHMGTKILQQNVVTNGGRVLAITGIGDTPGIAVENAYECIKCINFEGMHYRNDIGKSIVYNNYL